MKNQALTPQDANTELIRTLINCALACEVCEATCLQENDVTMMTRCIELDRDCADICLLGARFLQRDAEIAPQYVGLCEEICRLCAEECRKHEADHCQTCAEVCERCAAACHTYQASVAVH